MITSRFDNEQIVFVMQASPSLRRYSNRFIETLVVSLTFLPIVILIWFYRQLSEQIPVFLSLTGEVEVWAPKSIASVFRVPAMAIDLQVICLLMKYASIKFQGTTVLNNGHQEEITTLAAQFWDWLRCLVAFKMAAESLEIVFTSLSRLNSLSKPGWLIAWAAAIVAMVVASIYGYRLWRLMRTQKGSKVSPAREHLIAGVLYFNRQDPSLFVNNYLFNFGNKWVYLLIGSLVAYPLLVFLPG
jgi:uncharacterized membrane protein